MKVKSESEVAQSCPTLSEGFSKQEYWSGVPLKHVSGSKKTETNVNRPKYKALEAGT